VTGAAVGAGAAGFAATGGGGAGAGMVALTTFLQAGARLATFFCRQLRASLPPGETPEHFDMKSERQLARRALCCSDVTCALAGAAIVKVIAPTAAASARNLVCRIVISLSPFKLRNPSIGRGAPSDGHFCV
jgi:hypothetical protein